MATNSHPSAWRSRDGHLWFASPKGLVEVAPAHFRLNKLPPPVVLERFAVDDVDQPLHGNGTSLKIAAGHVHFQFDYAGLSFVAPQKVRYRYMLQGFDRKWTEAGARRSAYYTNIPPGNYTFRVEAANNDGVWNNTGAELSFDLQRHFYQTLWFYGLLLLAMAGSIFLVIRRRLRAAEREFSVVLGERSRIAREIHDTLAQGYVGVSVQLELLAELLRLKKLDAAAKQLDTTREYVREGLADARQSIWALRTQDSRDVRFPVKLRRMAEHAGSAHLTSHFSVFGAYRPLPAAKEREMLRVAQEAIHNVKKHAEASELFVRLEYGSEMIVLEVRDNGRGGAVAQESGFAPGHFGMTGMRERAEAIGGTLEVESEPGRGTTIRLRVPATAATRESDGETAMTTEPIRVLVVEDHNVVRQGLVALLSVTEGLEVVGEAADGLEAIAQFRKYQPTVTLIDLRLPKLGGVDAIIRIRKDAPDARFIVLTTYDGDEDIYRALKAGAKAYLLKGMTSEELIAAIRAVHAGKSHIPPVIAERLAERMGVEELTPRESDVLEQIVQGKSNKEIATELEISEATVKTHINSLLSKLGVTDRTQAATAAIRRGLVQLESPKKLKL